MDKKSRCVNKKLHPYLKTGIYGWLGEEVDDNDYMICPICDGILAMNYWDYSAEHDGDNKCFNCGQELDYSEIYDFEDTLYFRQLLEMKEDKIADLEAKLAESEKEKQTLIKGEFKKCCEDCCAFDEQVAIANDYLNECNQLKQQLSEKDQAIENWKTMYESVMQTCNNDAKEIERLREQLAEKEIEELKKGSYKVTLGTTPSNQIDFTENFYVIQNQTAIAVLEEMLENEIYLNVIPDFECGDYVSSKIIKTKIEELKNGRN